jgi:hypothetical protein
VALKDCPPWNQREVLIALDHRDLAADKGDGVAVVGRVLS